MTRYYSYYASNENDDDNFDEYDPTPYEGGYDMGLTYGRPLPPSSRICYRNSSSSAEEEDYEPPEFSSFSEPNAYDEEKVESEYSNYTRPSHAPKTSYSNFEQNEQQEEPSPREEEEPTLAGEGGYGRKKLGSSGGSRSSSWWGGCCSSSGAEQ